MFDLYLDNFRCFVKQDFNFSRINILIGENSAGKSSILKFLLALKQSIDNPLESNFKLNGAEVDLGNYEETVYYHKKNLNIRFAFLFGDSYFKFFSDFITEYFDIKGVGFLKDSNFIKEVKVKFDLSKNLDKNAGIKTHFYNKTLGELIIDIPHLENKGSKFDKRFKCKIVYKKSGNASPYIFEDIDFTKYAFMSLIESQSLFRELKNQEIDQKIFYEIAYFLISQNYIDYHAKKIKFVNPIMTNPSRFYFKKDKSSVYNTVDLEKVIDHVQRGNNQSNKLLADLSKLLKNFELADDIDLIEDAKLPVTELRIKIRDLFSNVKDVGYGVALQLPILFQALLSENGKVGETILIEQPEVHLHPRLQAKFIEALLSIGSKNSYFIETHSEHILRMLQVLVKNKKFGLKSSDISIHYFKRDNLKATVIPISIFENGQLSQKLPSGFYDNSYYLSKSLLE